MKDSTPPDYTQVPDPDPHQVPRTVTFSTQPDGCTAVRYRGGKIGRPVMLGYVQKSRAAVCKALRQIEGNRHRFGCLAELGVVWTHDEELVRELLCDAETTWAIH